MSMFWWLVKNEQLKYYRNRNAEFQRREKERKQKEEQEKQKRIEQHKRYLERKPIEDEIKYLEDTIRTIKYPTIYNKDNHIIVNRNLLLDLNNRINTLGKKQLEKFPSCEIPFKYIVKDFNVIKEQYKEYFNENVEQKQQNKKPNKLSNPKLYNTLAHNIQNKKFKNEKEKMKMIKIVGESGLTTEERKNLISMIK